MSSPDQAVQTQINNIQKKTGKTLAELAAIAKKSGLTRHGELRDMFKEKLGLGHGDANSLVHAIFESMERARRRANRKMLFWMKFIPA